MEMVGLLAVEMFITHDRKALFGKSEKGGIGKGSKILVNEIAPRPHNSGHWTMDACAASQFEQFIRAIVGLPFGSVERHHDAIMKNLIGDDVDNWLDHNSDSQSHLHLYGKAEARTGRKMGHVNTLYPVGKLPKE
jgi:5-(carboxyamino)imidazole ribonucleotide synthase